MTTSRAGLFGMRFSPDRHLLQIFLHFLSLRKKRHCFARNVQWPRAVDAYTGGSQEFSGCQIPLGENLIAVMFR